MYITIDINLHHFPYVNQCPKSTGFWNVVQNLWRLPHPAPLKTGPTSYAALLKCITYKLRYYLRWQNWAWSKRTTKDQSLSRFALSVNWSSPTKQALSSWCFGICFSKAASVHFWFPKHPSLCLHFLSFTPRLTYIQYNGDMSATKVYENWIKCSGFLFILAESHLSLNPNIPLCTFEKRFCRMTKERHCQDFSLDSQPFFLLIFNSVLTESNKLLKIFTKQGIPFDSDLQIQVYTGTIIYSKLNIAHLKCCSFKCNCPLSWLFLTIFSSTF